MPTLLIYLIFVRKARVEAGKVRSFSEKETVNFKFLNISRENAYCNVKLLVRGTLLCYAEIRKTDGFAGT